MAKPICPICGKRDQVIRILYGYPAEEAQKDEAAGKIKLGGCVIHEDIKKWHCKRDDLDFNPGKNST